MSSHVLKQIAPNLIVPLTHCFNLCLNYSYFPEEWKNAWVCLVFKKGPNINLEGHCTISITSIVGKLLDALT